MATKSPQSLNSAARGNDHHFVVVYRRARRELGRGPTYWIGHVTHITSDGCGVEAVRGRISFKVLDELPGILRRCMEGEVSIPSRESPQGQSGGNLSGPSFRDSGTP